MKKQLTKNVQRAAVTALAMSMALGSAGAVLADENDKYVLGDLNGDKSVDIKDSALLKRYLAGWDIEFVSYGLDGGSPQTTDDDTKKDIPEGAVRNGANGHYYYLFESNSWSEAKAWCSIHGGHLATLTSGAENKFVFDYMKSQEVNSAVFGLSDEEEEGKWKWVTGESFDYSNWGENQPDGGTRENYGQFYEYINDYEWNDTGISSRLGYYICEWDVKAEGDAVATELTILNTSGGDFIKDVSQATVTFVLNNASSDVKVSVQDVTDTEVYSQTFDSCEEGSEYTFKWDGKNTDGNYVNDGVYHVVVKAGTIETSSDTIKFISQSGFNGGDGSEANPYQVATFEQLKKVGNSSTRYFKQTSNIDANYETIQALGSADLPFKGHYDGNNCKISNAMIKDGLFYQLAKGSVVENLTFEGCSVTSSINLEIGILAKYNSGTVQNCTFNKCTANVSGRNSIAGIVSGIIQENGSVMNCSVSEANVSSSGVNDYNSKCYAGGICGNNYGKITNSSAKSIDIKAMGYGVDRYSGGIAGWNCSTGVISYCVTDGTVTSSGDYDDRYSGGIVAWNDGQVLHCTSDADVVTSGSYGYNFSGKISAGGNGVVVND